jgi:hypothetical protein
MCHCKCSIRIHVRICKYGIRILLEFGMRYPCLSLVIDKYRLLIRCLIFFDEFVLEYEFFIAFI